MPLHEEKLRDPQHHKHSLILNDCKSTYTCDGCGEHGIHSGYVCGRTNCNFVLHEQCFEKFGKHFRFNRFRGCEFEFVKRLRMGSKTSTLRLAVCNVCAKPINGYAYTTNGHDSVNLHPPCATLPSNLGVMNLVDDIKSKCSLCGHRSLPGVPNSWAYISQNIEPAIRVHVGCAKDMILGPNKGNIYAASTIQAAFVKPISNIKHSSTAIVPSTSKTIVSSRSKTTVPSSSTVIVPYDPMANVPRKHGGIKKFIEAFSHAVAAVLGPIKAILSVKVAAAAIASAL